MPQDFRGLGRKFKCWIMNNFSTMSIQWIKGNFNKISMSSREKKKKEEKKTLPFSRSWDHKQEFMFFIWRYAVDSMVGVSHYSH